MASLDFVVDSFVGSDGSRYYGTLRNGVPSGLGTCIWPNSCHYDGEWRNGVMHGFGTYVWKNGQRYDGEWKDGRREGIGIKTYVDGSMYDGFWRSGKKHGLGVFRPAPEEPNSRRHSNNHGWQSSAGAAAGQQQGQQQGADGPLEPTGGGMHHVESSQVLAEAEDDAAAQAAAAVAAANAVRGQQAHQGPRVAATTPFAEAAHFLNSEPSVLIDSIHPAGKQQHQERWQPTLAVLTNGDSDAAASLQQRASSLAAAAAEADMPSTSPTNMARAATGASGGEAAAAGPGAAAAAAPRKLFVREYDMGQLLREYPLTAEEIKMIFGFLWPKNKVRRRVQRVLRRGPRMQKKLGEVVYKGHYSYSLMLELQLGIRYSVGRALRPRGASAQSGSSAVSLLRSSFALHGLRPWWSMSAGVSGVSCVSGGHTKEDDQDEQQRQQQQQRGASEAAVVVADEDVGELCGQDFREKAAVYFPSSGSSTTPAHPSMDFMWRDYCPRVFRRLRKAAGIDEADYMLSLAGAQALRQLNSPGKSGSMFLLSEDERFLVKTMRKSEMSVLLGMLEAYSEHMERHPNSLITRFFGLHKVTPAHGRSVRFVVMANIFVTDLQIHRRYDIKGSTDGRTVGPEGRNKAADGDPNIIFKDLDVDMRIVLEQAQHEALLQQLAADSDLLKRVGVMDYSLLLGVHYPARNYTRMSLEPVHSQSLDGLAPQASPLPGGAGASTVPGSGLTSAQGSFLLAEPYSSSAAGAAAVAGGAGVGGAAGASTRHLTVSDDEVQQPPQLLRLAAQQQAQTYAQQQMQQQEASNATGGGAEVPGGLAGGGGRSGRSSYEQVPYAPVQFPIGRSSTSEDVQMPPVAAAAFTLPPGIGAGSTGGSAFAGGFPAGGFGSAAGTAGGAGSAAGSHHGGDRSSMLAGGASAGAAGARNWELWSGAAEQEELLGKVVERMKEMGFSEQRMKDVAELARLKILGGKLKKSAARKEPPSAVLQAMQQQRQEAEGALVDGPLAHGALLPVAPSSPDAAAAAAAAALGTPAAAIPPAPLVVRPTLPSHLTSLRGAFTGLGVPFEEDEEAVDTPMALGLPDPKAPAAAAGNAAAGLLGSGRLGINMPAKAVPTVQPLGGSSGGKGGAAAAAAAAGAAAALDHRLGPEEVVLCFGIIDILQDYSTRKVLERTVKGVTHDKAAISVAPPKQYARRFLDFATRQVFMSEQEYRSSLAHSGYGSSSQADTLAGVQQQQQLGVAAMQSPWASEGVLYPADAGPVQQGLQQPMQQQEQQQLKQPSQQQQQQPHLAQNGSFGAQMPLVTEDSFPLPPGQLGSEGSGIVLAAPGPAAAAAGGVGVVMQQGSAVASHVLPDEQSMLLELLAAPTGMIQLTSGGGGGNAAVDAAAESNGSKYVAAAGQMLSEEQVQVTLQSLGSLDCPAAAAVSNGRQQQLPAGHAAAAAVGEHGDGVLVPAVVVELQGVADKSPASKQGSLERQMELTAGANGVKGVNGHVVVVNGVGQSS